ncbi:hypothetical protein QuyetLC_22620 [Bacillus anthracis]|uniref:Uncharacterized protein n=1 Tax=Bacillus anthracis TaxID=1392 RepID=A0A640NP97_BACAN|nr:hypothetical protein QuyetLC_22620 [Bacillus anthracis]
MAKYIEQLPRFSKRKGYEAEKQYIDNFIIFHKSVKDIAYAHFVTDNHSAIVLAEEIKHLLADFEIQQEKLLEEITKNERVNI